MKLERILCPIDFSEASGHAIDQARAIAGWYQARLTALHVCHDRDANEAAVADPLRDKVRQAFASAAGADSPVALDVLVESGPIVGHILDCATGLPADLIVMGTHGLGGFEHLILGSVTEKVLRKAGCPVLTVPRRAVATSKLPFRRIVCAVDFSDSSVRALRAAVSLAEESSAVPVLVHVLEWPWTEPPAPAFDELPHEQAVRLAEFRQYREKHAAALLDALVRQASIVDCVPVTRVVHGKPHVEILRAATEEHADLIVIGVQGHGALELALLGSTTNQIVRRATCPVLTVRDNTSASRSGASR